MPILESHHDRGHPVESDSAWSESYYFNAYDPPTDTGFFTRIGIRPNEGTIDASMSIWLPDNTLGEYRAVRAQNEMIDSDLQVDAVRYVMLEPMRTWHVALEGQVQARPCLIPRAAMGHMPAESPSRPVGVKLSATFSSLTPAIGTDGQGSTKRSSRASSEAAASVGKGHLEQAGRWTGDLVIGDTRYRWQQARGNRDRSWGPRRWGGPRMWRWFSINFDDAVHFGGIRIGTEAGDLHRGWMWDERGATSIREWDLRTELDRDHLTHAVTNLVARDSLGVEHTLRGDLLRVASLAPRSASGPRTVVNEGLARWVYRERVGYGIAEYLHQLDDDGKPLVQVE